MSNLNNCVYYPTLNIDLEKIKEITMRNLWKRMPGEPIHHRVVDDESYLKEIRYQYPFLSNLYGIYVTKQNYITPIHIDAGRKCALNIPISNTENSATCFYKTNDDIVLRNMGKKLYNAVLSDTEEIFRFTLTSPALINTSIPHGVLDHGAELRIILSWSVVWEYSFEDTKNILMSMC
jgi:hypothetical protein